MGVGTTFVPLGLGLSLFEKTKKENLSKDKKEQLGEKKRKTFEK